jgi:hypothetical protein
MNNYIKASEIFNKENKGYYRIDCIDFCIMKRIYFRDLVNDKIFHITLKDEPSKRYVSEIIKMYNDLIKLFN